MPAASSGRFRRGGEKGRRPKNKQTKIKNDYETAKSCKHNPASEMRFGLEISSLFYGKK
jgi:hypothetical protein